MTTPDTEKAVGAATKAIDNLWADRCTEYLNADIARAALEASGYPARIAELEKLFEEAREHIRAEHQIVTQLRSQLTAAEQRVEKLTEALREIVDFCDDPYGSEKPESLAMGLARLLPVARASLRNSEGGNARHS